MTRTILQGSKTGAIGAPANPRDFAEALRFEMFHYFNGAGVHFFEPVLRALEQYVGNAALGDQAGRALQDEWFKAVHVNLHEIDLLDVQLLGYAVKRVGANQRPVWI